MFEALSVVLVFVLALYGISELIQRFSVFLAVPRSSQDYITVLLSDDTAIQSLRATVMKLKRESNNYFRGVIAVDLGLSDIDKEYVMNIANSVERVYFTSAEDYLPLLRRLNRKEHKNGKC